MSQNICCKGFKWIQYKYDAMVHRPLKSNLRKEQSAMEYLMTYGWSILLIAITLAGMFELGIFNGSGNVLPTVCVAQSGFLCTNPQMNSTGNLTVLLGSAQINPITIVGTACTSNSSTPNNFIFNLMNISSEQEKQLGFECPKGSGSFFDGYLWIKYNTKGVNDIVVQVAKITAQVSTQSSVGIPGDNGQGEVYIANYLGGTGGYGNVVIFNSQTSSVIGSIDSSPSAFDHPDGIFVSGSNIYVANAGASNVLIFNTDGALTGAITSGAFDYPEGIALSGSNIYVANADASNVLIFNTDGALTGAITSGAFDFPQGIFVSGSNIYVMNTVASNFLIFNTDGALTGTITSGAFDNPQGISIINNEAYIANSYGGSYEAGNIISVNLTTNTINGNIGPINGIDYPTFVAVAGSTAYISDPNYEKILMASLINNQLNGNITSSAFYYPDGIALSGSNIYVTNTDANNVLIFNTDGALTGAITSGAFDSPQGIALSGSNIYVANTYANNVLIFNTDGALTGAITSGAFAYPAGIALSGSNIYVTNPGANNVLIFNTDGALTGAITSGAFDSPQGIALSGSNIYVMNTDASNVLIFNTDGALTGTITSGMNYPDSIYKKHPISPR